MTIRRKLLTLAIGGVIPLLVVGLTLLWSVWQAKEQQLNEALEQQAELAAVVFDRWLDAQAQPLRTIAAYREQRQGSIAGLKEDQLRATRVPRSHWHDLRILDSSGKVVVRSH